MSDLSLYFDYASATPLDPKSLRVMLPYLSDDFYNPSAIYLKAINVKKAINNARAIVAKNLGCQLGEVIFTAGGTEANNLAISGVMQQYPNNNLLISSIEHDSVLLTANNYNYQTIPVNNKGIVLLDSIERLINDQTVLISVMLANNEIGSIQPIKQLAEIVTKIRQQRRINGNNNPLILHTDACQAVNYLDVSVKRLGVDLLTINSGKIYGPKQTGALYIKGGVVLSPLIYGGGQEKSLRSGTENASNIIGFANSLQIVRDKAKNETKRLSELRDYLINRLISEFNSIEVNGPKGSHRLANNVHITIKGTDNERLLMELDELGIMVATGSACSASKDEPSHVLKAIGKDNEDIFSSIRITMGRYTDMPAIDQLVNSLKQILAKN
jgi:cysteine desulfurase